MSNWSDIIDIDYQSHNTIGLKADGTVIAVGDNDKGECNVENWTDIIAISTGEFHTLGLKSDGSVVAVGDNSDGQCSVGW